MEYYPRAILPLLVRRLAARRVVVLTGSRQSGKTTLVRHLLPHVTGSPPQYFDLDDPDERLRLAARPVELLNRAGSLVVIDEIQKMPALLDVVKLLADRPKGPRFLLLGSAQILLMKQVRETLAGRATVLDLWPFAIAERVASQGEIGIGLDLLWQGHGRKLREQAGGSLSADALRARRASADESLRWGGYPPLAAIPGDGDRRQWLRDFRRTYLERDLADLGRVSDLDQFALAQNLIAARTAQILSYSDVARDLGVAVNTVKKYLRFLEMSYQVHLLRPLAGTGARRLVKSPKIYWMDAGLCRLLAERESEADGPLFETHVLCELIKWRSWADEPPGLSFYRTAAGREVDFVLQARDRLLAIEAKASARVSRRDAASLVAFLEESPGIVRSRRMGVVIYRGRSMEELAPGVWAVPDWMAFGPAA